MKKPLDAIDLEKAARRSDHDRRLENLVRAIVAYQDEAPEAVAMDWLSRIVAEVAAVRATPTENIPAKINEINRRYGKEFWEVVSHVESFIGLKASEYRGGGEDDT